MHDPRPILNKRVARHLGERIIPAISRVVAPLTIEHWEVTDAPAAPGQGEPADHQTALAATYTPFQTGTPWGPAWGTTWFRLTGAVPTEAADLPLELEIDLGWDRGAGPGFQAEGLALRPDGSVIKALNPRNAWLPVEADDQGRIEVYLEAAANPIVSRQGPTELGDVLAAGRIIPVGGMWVESDANLPGGEAFVRQLVEGTSWFDEHLGKRCRGVWLPDSFGYAAAGQTGRDGLVPDSEDLLEPDQ